MDLLDRTGRYLGLALFLLSAFETPEEREGLIVRCIFIPPMINMHWMNAIFIILTLLLRLQSNNGKKSWIFQI